MSITLRPLISEPPTLIRSVGKLTRLVADLDMLIYLADAAIALAEQNGASGYPIALLRGSLNKIKQTRKTT